MGIHEGSAKEPIERNCGPSLAPACRSKAHEAGAGIKR